MKRALALLILAAMFALPVGAQTPGTIVCTPTGGQVICEPQATPSGKRIAIVAAVAVGVAVLVYVIRKAHKRHAPTAVQPQQSTAPLPGAER